MRCRDARRALRETRLGLAPAVVREAVRRHVASCPECAAEARAEEELSRALAALNDEPAPPVDATARVMRALAESRLPGREPVPLREAAWAIAALSAAAVAICLGGIAMGPSLWAALRQAAPEAVWAAALALKLGRSVTEAISFLGVFARAGLDLLSAAAGLAIKAEPLARAAAAACAALMLTLTTVIVRRDLRRRAVRADQE